MNYSSNFLSYFINFPKMLLSSYTRCPWYLFLKHFCLKKDTLNMQQQHVCGLCLQSLGLLCANASASCSRREKAESSVSQRSSSTRWGQREKEVTAKNGSSRRRWATRCKGWWKDKSHTRLLLPFDKLPTLPLAGAELPVQTRFLMSIWRELWGDNVKPGRWRGTSGGQSWSVNPVRIISAVR